MCNYCQTGSIFGNTCCGSTRWRVQRICYDCHGNIYVTLSNGCQCRRAVYSSCQGVGETNAVSTTNNGSVRCCGAGTSETTQCSATQNVTTSQSCDWYYARQYGLYPYNGGRSCGCGYGCGSGSAL